MSDRMQRWCGFLVASVVGWFTHAAIRQAETPFQWRCPQPKCLFLVASTDPENVTDAINAHSSKHTQEAIGAYR